jgi:hypothetical protein
VPILARGKVRKIKTKIADEISEESADYVKLIWLPTGLHICYIGNFQKVARVSRANLEKFP